MSKQSSRRRTQLNEDYAGDFVPLLIILAVVALVCLAVFDVLGIPAWIQADYRNLLAGIMMVAVTVVTALILTVQATKTMRPIILKLWRCPIRTLRRQPCLMET